MNMPCRNTSALSAKMREDDRLYDDLARQRDREAFADHMMELHTEELITRARDDEFLGIGGAWGAFIESSADGDECSVGRLFVASLRNQASLIYDAGDAIKFGWPR